MIVNYDNLSTSSDDNEELENLEEYEESHEGPSKTKRSRKNLMTSRVTAALDKCKVSDRDAIHIITALLEALSLDINDFVLSRSSVKRAREMLRKESATSIKSTFSDINLDFVVIHWDSKILTDITGKSNIDRLPVVATAPGIEQLLGVPSLTSCTGSEVSSAVYDILLEWSLEDKIQAMVVDTTASNTGRLNGACILLEQKLERQLLLLACRHHMYEIVLAGVFSESKLSVMSGPDIPIFKKFQKNWPNIDKSNYSTFETDQAIYDKLKDVSTEVLLFAEKKIREELPRNDYKEFLELIIIFLGGKPPNGTNFRQPGAYHLARWMAKAIYCLKIFMFKQQYKLIPREESAIKEICCFIIICYAEQWFNCMNAIEAPLNDIIFLKKLVSYKNINKKIAEVAIKKFINHLWYLNDECILFSLFDERIKIEEKRKMVEILKENNDDNIEPLKKLSFKPEEITDFLNRDLPTDLFTPHTFSTFSRFNISTDFLQLDPLEWPNNDSYKKARSIIISLKVVNDTAERNVKLMEEFNQKATKNEEQKQYLLQVCTNKY